MNDGNPQDDSNPNSNPNSKPNSKNSVDSDHGNGNEY